MFNPDNTIKFEGVFINDKYKPKKSNFFYLYYIIGFLVVFISFLIIYKNIINKNKIEKITLNNFEYYIGELKNGLPNGKGKKFNKMIKLFMKEILLMENMKVKVIFLQEKKNIIMVISKMENLTEKEYYIKNGKKNLYLVKILIKR